MFSSNNSTILPCTLYKSVPYYIVKYLANLLYHAQLAKGGGVRRGVNEARPTIPKGGSPNVRAPYQTAQGGTRTYPAAGRRFGWYQAEAVRRLA